MTTIEVRQTAVFRQSPDVVRCHFLDIQHHLAHDVHKGVRYTILTEDRERLRLTQEFRVLGMKKRDELVLYATADGKVVQQFLRGDFAGGGIELVFTPEGEGTRVEARLYAPLKGFNKLMAPIVKWQVEKITRQALAEDQRDLDSGYQPGAWARTALEAARAA